MPLTSANGDPLPTHMVVIVGPTASGKTALAVALAERFRGEIVSADARQIYRGMDIGTAKPTARERARAPHHLIDIRDPDEPFSLAEFLDLARAALAEIAGRGRLPIVAGGTGQYIRALLQGWQTPRVPPAPALRARLEARARAEGPAVLAAELARRDPAAAARIDPRNTRRVIRALEVLDATGRPSATQATVAPAAARTLTLGLDLPRALLYERIDRRVEAMFAAGLVEEVRGLMGRGFDCTLPSMSSIGYREVCGLLAGTLTLDEVVARTKTSTHRLARTQANWFRRTDPSIHWLDATTGPPIDAASALVAPFLQEDGNMDARG